MHDPQVPSVPLVTVSRTIAAPADSLFAILARPVNHPRLDGSGMVRAAHDDVVLSEVGDVFVMAMHNDEMGSYAMANHVVEFARDRRIVWQPVMVMASREEDQALVGKSAEHRWGYELTPLDSATTVVTELYDCSRSPAWLRAAVKGGVGWIESMTISLERLDALSRA